MKKISLIMAIFIVFAASLAANLNTNTVQTSYVIGKKFDLSLMKGIYTGAPVKFDGKKPILIHVFASWCANCKKDLQKIIDLKSQHSLKTVGLVWQDKITNVKKRPRGYKVYDIIAHDPTDKLAFEMGITGVPEIFLISKEGIVVYNDKGEFKDEDLKNALQIEFSKL